jgi:tripartite-type tricarboxylate transporter receptor subunit TctC
MRLKIAPGCVLKTTRREAPMHRPRPLLAAVALGALVLPGAAAAQEYPSRAIHIVVAFPPGGPTDTVSRLLADKLKVSLGQNVIVENKPGANGAIGADYVAKGEADGHLLFMTTAGAVVITPHLSKPNYDTLRDFAPVTLVMRPSSVMVVKPDHPANSAKDLVALAKANPGAIPIASTGVGSMTHLALELLQSASGAKFLHVPYRGAAPALNDTLGGQVQAMFADTPVLLPQIQGGKLKAIAIASGSRNPTLPDVPTLIEQGYPDTVADNWYGLVAPAKTPPAVIAKLNAATVAALNLPEVRDQLLKLGALPSPTSSAEFGKFIAEELARWGRVVREKNIKEG